MSAGAEGKDWKHEAYLDIAKPWAKELGEVAGGLVAKCLMPARFILWSADQIAYELGPMLREALQKVPEGQVVEPSPSIAVPAIMALTYSGHDAPLNQMFANLIASSMDGRTSSRVHPAFVSILKEMLPAEARLIATLKPQFFSKLALTVRVTSGGAQFTQQAPLVGCSTGAYAIADNQVHLTNLGRAGLVETTDTDEPFYDGRFDVDDTSALAARIGTALEYAGAPRDLGVPLIETALRTIDKQPDQGRKWPPPSARCSLTGGVRLTHFGELFRSACIDGPKG